MTPLERLRKATNEADDAVLEDYLEQAKCAIMAHRFPYQEWPEEIETRYLDIQYRCALALYQKRGGQFEVAHSENGTSRSWASEDIPESLLNEIVPFVGVVG